MADLISLKKIKRHYDVGGEVVRALDGVNLTINQNEYISIMGPSGSGKSTLVRDVLKPALNNYFGNFSKASKKRIKDQIARIIWYCPNFFIGCFKKRFTLYQDNSSIRESNL